MILALIFINTKSHNTYLQVRNAVYVRLIPVLHYFSIIYVYMYVCV